MISKILAGGAVVASLVGGSAAAASASTQHPAYHPWSQPKAAIASVEINGEGYEQYIKFEALQGFGHYKGYVDVTNFQYADANSHVWAPSDLAEPLTFTVGSSTYSHTLNGGLVFKALSNNNVEFTGTGQFPATGTPTFDWAISGDVKGTTVTFTITYLNPTTKVPTGYTVSGTGTIAPNGSASGTATDSTSTDLNWTLPAGSFQTVQHFYAPVTSDSIHGRNVTVTYVVPAGHPAAGDTVTYVVHNGGSPAADTWAQGVNGGTPVPETVEAGHIAAFNL